MIQEQRWVWSWRDRPITLPLSWWTRTSWSTINCSFTSSSHNSYALSLSPFFFWELGFGFCFSRLGRFPCEERETERERESQQKHAKQISIFLLPSVLYFQLWPDPLFSDIKSFNPYPFYFKLLFKPFFSLSFFFILELVHSHIIYTQPDHFHIHHMTHIYLWILYGREFGYETSNIDAQHLSI